MKTLSLSAGALLAATVQASVPGVVNLDLSRRQAHPRLTRRATSSKVDQTTVINNITQGGYFIQCKIGTPGQPLTLQLDTGSSDIWAPSSDSEVCTTASRTAPNGCDLGSFDSSESSTFNVVGQDLFDISYVDNSHAKGDYFTDSFSIGSDSLHNVTMGLASDTDIAYGLVGVGYATEEAIVSTEKSLSAAYANLPVQMLKEGAINTIAYSLWLNDLDSSSGQILFGGIDTAKYKGDLTRISIYKDQQTGTYSSFLVALTSVNATSASGKDVLSSDGFPAAVVLDSGTTLTYVPQDLAETMWAEAGAEYNADAGIAVIPCSRANSGGKFSFGFGGVGGPIIEVGMDELVLQEVAQYTAGPNKGEYACEFGIANQTDLSEPFLLGDTFLRSAYVVYDLVNNQIAIAPTNFNASDSNIVPFPSSAAPIPSATVAPNQAAVASSSGIYRTPAFSASAGFASATAGSSSSSGSSGSGSGSSNGGNSGSTTTGSSSSASSTGKSAGTTPSVPLDLLSVGLVSSCMFVFGSLFVM